MGIIANYQCLTSLPLPAVFSGDREFFCSRVAEAAIDLGQWNVGIFLIAGPGWTGARISSISKKGADPA